MEFLFPLSMLGVGLVIGALSLWFITRAKIDSEQATLIERLAGREDQVRQLREALDRETAQAADTMRGTAGRPAWKAATSTPG